MEHKRAAAIRLLRVILIVGAALAAVAVCLGLTVFTFAEQARLEVTHPARIFAATVGWGGIFWGGAAVIALLVIESQRGD